MVVAVVDLVQKEAAVCNTLTLSTALSIYFLYE